MAEKSQKVMNDTLREEKRKIGIRLEEETDSRNIKDVRTWLFTDQLVE